MPKIDLSTVPTRAGSGYPAEYAAPCQARSWLALGDAAGLTQFGVNLVTLAPGAWSSQRHWHSHEDEFVFVVSGEVVLVTDAGETLLVAGDCAGFPAGERDGHCLQNRSPEPVRLLAAGSRNPLDHGEYPDIDMVFTADGRYLRKDGSSFAPDTQQPDGSSDL